MKQCTQYFIVYLSAMLLIALMTMTALASADTHVLSLAHITLIDRGIAYDSRLDPERPHGTLIIETMAGNAISEIDYEAWFQGDDGPLVSDVAVALDYSANGARYKVISLLSEQVYHITFLRRAPRGSGYDPATIMMIKLDDESTLIMDFRYVARDDP